MTKLKLARPGAGSAAEPPKIESCGRQHADRTLTPLGVRALANVGYADELGRDRALFGGPAAQPTSLHKVQLNGLASP